MSDSRSGLQSAAAPGSAGTTRPARGRLAAAAMAVTAVFAAVLLSLTGGCDNRKSTSHYGPLNETDSDGSLIKSLAENINQLDEFDTQQMVPQVRDRLNQWVFNERPEIHWQRQPLLATLPAKANQLPEVKALDSIEYSAGDVVFLQEAVWLRDIGKRIAAGSFDDLETAELLFDWTVRNMQLVEKPKENSARMPHDPHQLLLLCVRRRRNGLGSSHCSAGSADWTWSCWPCRPRATNRRALGCRHSSTGRNFICSTPGWACRFRGRPGGEWPR